MNNMSERKISLRRMTNSDLEVKVKWANDPEVNKHIGFNHKITLAETKEWFHRQLQDPNIELFTILLGDESIGYMKLVKDRFNNGELHMAIGEKQYWGKGYGKEAVREFLDYSFVEEKLSKVFLHVLQQNERAFNLYKKCGFKLEGKLTKHQKHIDGKYHDIYTMAILRDEYLNKVITGKKAATEAGIHGHKIRVARSCSVK